MNTPRTVLAGLAALVCAATYDVPAQSDGSTPPSSHAIAFISDTQTPLWIESIFLGHDRNEEATDSLMADIHRIHPSALFMLGDLVSVGALAGAWETMDQNIQELRRDQIPVHAILGNHELMFYPHAGEHLFAETFPEHRPTGYQRTVDSVAVVLLNSNFGNLSGEETDMQNRWYRRTLDSLDSNLGVACIVVCCHHAPLTNSTVVKASREVREQFVPPFLASPKCVLFLSGHCHAYEHFKESGKNFMVIGGGGGTRHRLLTGADQIWQDISPPGKPLFHYVVLERHGASLRVIVRQLREDFSGVAGGYTCDVHPAPAPGPGHHG